MITDAKIQQQRNAYAKRLREFVNATPEQRKAMLLAEREMQNKRKRIKKRTGDNISPHEKFKLASKKGPVKKPSLSELGKRAREKMAKRTRQRNAKIKALRGSWLK
jgi:hypothetical protein